MAREDIVEMVSTNENTWVFVDSQMVSVEELETIELNDATEIRINPGMVGGAETFTVLVASKAGDEAVLMTKQETAPATTPTGSSLMAKWLTLPALQTLTLIRTTSCGWFHPSLAVLRNSPFKSPIQQATRLRNDQGRNRNQCKAS